MMDDPAIPMDAVIRVAIPAMPSRLVMAVQDRQRLLKPSASPDHDGAGEPN